MKLHAVLRLRRLEAVAALFVWLPLMNAQTTQVSLCTVVSRTGDFENNVVTVSARYALSMHGSMIWDEDCPAYGFSLRYSDGAKGRANLMKAIDWGYWGTLAKIVHGRFVGIAHFNVDPRLRYFQVMEIRDIVASPDPGAMENLKTK